MNTFDPLSIADQKSLNNYKLLAEDTYFHEHQIMIAKQAMELEEQRAFIFSILMTKLNFQLSEMLHILALTKEMWVYIFDHIDFFFTVILQENVLTDPERLRAMLSPYNINHINLKRRTKKYLIITRKEQIVQIKKAQTRRRSVMVTQKSESSSKLAAKKKKNNELSLQQFVNEMI